MNSGQSMSKGNADNKNFNMSFYYADNIPTELFESYTETKEKIKKELYAAFNAVSDKFKDRELNLKLLSETIGDLVPIYTKHIKDLCANLRGSDKNEIWCGMMRIPNPQRNTFQYGQV